MVAGERKSAASNNLVGFGFALNRLFADESWILTGKPRGCLKMAITRLLLEGEVRSGSCLKIRCRGFKTQGNVEFLIAPCSSLQHLLGNGSSWITQELVLRLIPSVAGVGNN